MAPLFPRDQRLAFIKPEIPLMWQEWLGTKHTEWKWRSFGGPGACLAVVSPRADIRLTDDVTLVTWVSTFREA